VAEIEKPQLPRLAVGALGMVTIVAYGVAYYSYGALIDPIRSNTGFPLSRLLARLGARRTIILSFVTAGAGALLLLGSDWLPAALAYTVLADASIRAIYTLQGIYTNELVGTESLNLLMGGQQAVFAMGGAAGPLLAESCWRLRIGTYLLCF
jgi:MFS family permease